jgi:TonB-dependent receptor
MENGVLAWKGGANDASRSFSDLDERALSGALNYQLSLGSPARPSALKVGGSYRDVHRDASSRSYDIINQRLDLAERTLSPELLFDGRFAAGADTNFLIATSSFGGEYEADEQVAAGYAMYDFALTTRLRAIAGARVERAEITVTSVDAQGNDTIAPLRDTDFLPALSMVLKLSDAQNLRVSASRTLSRPEYRELSPIAYVETGEDVVTRGNPDLARALIENYDMRWEWYPGSAEVLSVGVFAKRFHDPVERLYLATTGAPTIGFANAAAANNYGVELDLRKNLGLLGALGQPFTAFTNVTAMRSRIRIDDPLSAATNPERPMVGQAPYVVNAGLNYASATGRWSATGLYNVVGRRISLAGVNPLPDTYVEPRHVLDLSLQFPVWNTLAGKLNAKNLLDSPFIEKTGQLTRRRYTSGRVFSLGLTWAP